MKGDPTPSINFGESTLRLEKCPVLHLVGQAIRADDVRLRARRIHISEVLLHPSADVALVELMHLRPAGVRRREPIQNGLELFVVHADEVDRLAGGVVIHRGHHRNLVTHVANLVLGEQGLVVARRTHAEVAGRAVVRRQHRLDAGQALRVRSVDVEHARVGQGALKDGTHEHVRARQVVRVLRAAGHLFPGVNARCAPTDDRKRLVTHWPTSSVSSWSRMRSAASITPSTIL